MTTRSQRWRSSFLGVALVVALASWGLALAQPPAAEEPVIRVVVSLHPWADVIRQIGGERVAVTSLLPAGASPHAFEPLPSQAAELSRADLVVMNGGLDSWLDRLLQAVAPDAQHLRLMDIVDFAPLQGVEDHHDDGDGVTPQQETHPRALSAANPHIWLDPTIVMRAVPLLRAELALLDPAGEQLFQDNAASLLMDLDALDLAISQLLSGLAAEPFVPFHDAWPYFAERYGLTITATLEPFAGREPSARYVAETVWAIREAGASVVFAERQLNDRTALVVAESAGVTVATLDPIGGPPGPTRYQDLLWQNAQTIAEALRR